MDNASRRQQRCNEDLGLRRNQSCLCGSGLRFKRCCGSFGGEPPGRPTSWPRGRSLLGLLLQADQEGFEAGHEPRARSLKNAIHVSQAVNPGSGTVLAGVGVPAYLQALNRLMGQLYRPRDTGMGALHVGAIMFRDVFARVDIPIAYGQVGLDALTCSDLSAVQSRWLRSIPAELARFEDQFLDLVDLAFGLDDMLKWSAHPAEALAYANLAHMHLEAAAAATTAQCDLRGAIQSSLLATELVLKAAILSAGAKEGMLRSDFGHDTGKMLARLRVDLPGLDFDRVTAVLARMPPFVANRYASLQPARQETGHILMGAQYVASEIIRRLSGRDARKANPCSPPRSYPSGT